MQATWKVLAAKTQIKTWATTSISRRQLTQLYGTVSDEPMEIISMKHRLSKMPSRTFNFLSRRRLLSVLKICAKTNALKTSVRVAQNGLLCGTGPPISWYPGIRE